MSDPDVHSLFGERTFFGCFRECAGMLTGSTADKIFWLRAAGDSRNSFRWQTECVVQLR